MPSLKDLVCVVQWANTGTPFPEYATQYGDGVVETYIAVPSHPQTFTIRLTSRKFICEGLCMIVYIDGNYQCNRNRVNLEPHRKGLPKNRTEVDFTVRQKEKPMGDGVYMGREWRFDDHNIVPEIPKGVNEGHFDELGTIEVLVLRCQTENPNERQMSTSSSGEDSLILGDTNDTGDEANDSDAKEQDSTAAAEPEAESDGLGLMFGLFDGPSDYLPPYYGPQYHVPSMDYGQSRWRHQHDQHVHRPAEGPFGPPYPPQQSHSHLLDYRPESLPPNPPHRRNSYHRDRPNSYTPSAYGPTKPDRRVHFDFGDSRGPYMNRQDTYGYQPLHSNQPPWQGSATRFHSNTAPGHHSAEQHPRGSNPYADYPIPPAGEDHVYDEENHTYRSYPGLNHPYHSEHHPTSSSHLHNGPTLPSAPPALQPTTPISQQTSYPAMQPGPPHLSTLHGAWQTAQAPFPPHPVPVWVPPTVNPFIHPGPSIPHQPSHFNTPMFHAPASSCIWNTTQQQYPFPFVGGAPGVQSSTTPQSVTPATASDQNNGLAVTSATTSDPSNTTSAAGQDWGKSSDTNNTVDKAVNDGWGSTVAEKSNTNNNEESSGGEWTADQNKDSSTTDNAATGDWNNNANGNDNTGKNDSSGDWGDSNTNSNGTGQNSEGDGWGDSDQNKNGTGQDKSDADWSNNADSNNGGNDDSWNNNTDNNNSGQNNSSDGWGQSNQTNNISNQNDKSGRWGGSNTGVGQTNNWQNDQSNDSGGANFNTPTPAGLNTRSLYGPHGAYYTSKAWDDTEVPADAEEEPRYDVPQPIAHAKGISKQVQPGKGYIYNKKRCVPRYLDDLEFPYARFVFKYRTKEQIKNEIGIEITADPTGNEDVDALEQLDKAQLIQMVLRAKGVLGEIPEPLPKEAPEGPPVPSFEQVPIEPPGTSFLKYKLPPGRSFSNHGSGTQNSAGNQANNNTVGQQDSSQSTSNQEWLSGGNNNTAAGNGASWNDVSGGAPGWNDSSQNNATAKGWDGQQESHNAQNGAQGQQQPLSQNSTVTGQGASTAGPQPQNWGSTQPAASSGSGIQTIGTGFVAGGGGGNSYLDKPPTPPLRKCSPEIASEYPVGPPAAGEAAQFGSATEAPAPKSGGW